MALLQRDLVYHCLDRCQLVASAERHQYCAGSDSRVESLGQAPLGACVEVSCDISVELCKALLLFAVCVFVVQISCLPVSRCSSFHFDVLVCSVGVQELSAYIYYCFAVPVHNESRRLCHCSDLYTLEVLVCRELHEHVLVLCCYYAGHSLLRLGDSELCSIESFVLLRNCIELDLKAVSQLADGYADSARAKIVASLDESGGISVAEESLDLALFRSVTLLYLGAACLDRVRVVCLG